MQTRGRLVEDVKRACDGAFGQVRGQLYSLGFAACLCASLVLAGEIGVFVICAGAFCLFLLGIAGAIMTYVNSITTLAWTFT